MRWFPVVPSQFSSPTSCLGNPYSSTQIGGFPSKSNHSQMCHNLQGRHLKQTLPPAADLFPPRAPILADGVTPNSDTPG